MTEYKLHWHREADIIPFDTGSAAVTGISVYALRSLRGFLGLSENVTVKDRITRITNIDEALIPLDQVIRTC